MNETKAETTRKRVQIYTDGACTGNPGPGGWAAIVEIGHKKKEIHGNERMTTNNRMELTAVIRALKELEEPADVIIHSDSRYVVDGIEQGWAKSWKKNNWIKSNKKPALNPELWEDLLRLCDKHHVRFIWVKGHAGNPKNEQCDRLAVMEAKNAERGVP